MVSLAALVLFSISGVSSDLIKLTKDRNSDVPKIAQETEEDNYPQMYEQYYKSLQDDSAQDDNDQQIKVVVDQDLRYSNERRLLRKAGSKSKSSVSRPTSKNTSGQGAKPTSKITTTKRTITTKNTTWNSSSMRTYAPLVVGYYYRPVGVYLVYVSPYYGLTYYDGYGWNFYTQMGGYYDNAPLYNDVYYNNNRSAGGTGAAVAVIVVIIVLCICVCVLYAVCNGQMESGEEHDEQVVEEEVVVEEIVIEEKYDDDGNQQVVYPPGYGPGMAPPAGPPGQMPPQYPPGQMQMQMGAPPAYPPGYPPQQIQMAGIPPAYPPGQMPPQYPPGQMPPQYPPGQMQMGAPPAYPPGQGPPQYYQQ